MMGNLGFSERITKSGTYSRNQKIHSSKPVAKYTPTKIDFIKSFYAVLARWKSETAFISNPTSIIEHESFKAMVSNAELITPLIIEELRKEPSPLVWVLDIAYEHSQPYDEESAGDIEAMSNAWIAWAEENGRLL